MKTQITVTENASFHHMSDYFDAPDLDGLTLRQALKELRDVDFGDIGGMDDVGLSDGTYINVSLIPTYDGGWLMNSQRVVRFKYDNNGEHIIRAYSL